LGGEYKPIIILDYYGVLHLSFLGTLALLRRGLLIKKKSKGTLNLS
jgi:hypothetical protein